MKKKRLRKALNKRSKQVKKFNKVRMDKAYRNYFVKKGIVDA